MSKATWIPRRQGKRDRLHLSLRAVPDKEKYFLPPSIAYCCCHLCGRGPAVCSDWKKPKRERVKMQKYNLMNYLPMALCGSTDWISLFECEPFRTAAPQRYNINRSLDVALVLTGLCWNVALWWDWVAGCQSTRLGKYCYISGNTLPFSLSTLKIKPPLKQWCTGTIKIRLQ